MSEFKGEKLSHRKGQQGRINDEEKAHAMAIEEDPYQTEASAFQKYLTDPGIFAKEIALERQYRDSLTSEGDCLLPDDHPARKFKNMRYLTGQMRFEAYVNEGLTPQDFRHLADRWGEMRGAIYDLEQEVRTVPTPKLVAAYTKQKTLAGLHLIPRPTNDREILAGGIRLTNKSHESEINRMEVFLGRNAIEKELLARAYDAGGNKVKAQETRDVDVTTWENIKWAKNIFKFLTNFIRLHGGG